MFAFMVKKNNNNILYWWIKLSDSSLLFLLHAFHQLIQHSPLTLLTLSFIQSSRLVSRQPACASLHVRPFPCLLCAAPTCHVLNPCLLSFLFLCREVMKMNGQMDCHPSAQSAALSPSRHNNVKKVTGVGGTTYEISVWAGTMRPPPMAAAAPLRGDSLLLFLSLSNLDPCFSFNRRICHVRACVSFYWRGWLSCGPPWVLLCVWSWPFLWLILLVMRDNRSSICSAVVARRAIASGAHRLWERYGWSERHHPRLGLKYSTWPREVAALHVDLRCRPSAARAVTTRRSG